MDTVTGSWTLDRRGDARFLESLADNVNSTTSIESSLDIVLNALRDDRGYVMPRVYRRKRDECQLLRWLDLPEDITKGRIVFPVNNPILEKIMGNDETYYNPDISKDPSLQVGKEDPMYYAMIQEACSMFGVPYRGRPLFDPEREIKGAIIVNFVYDKMIPKEIREETDEELRKRKVKEILDHETALLRQIGKLIVGPRVASLWDRDKYEKLVEEKEHMATHDALTGVYNRRAFDDHIKQYFERAKEHDISHYLLIGDCDDLKGVNDSCGHKDGDAYLRNVANAFNSNDRVLTTYRFGGDEFCGAIQEDTPEAAKAVAEQIREEVRLWNAPIEYGKPATVSIGLAPAQMFDSVEEWIRAADSVLDQAKKQGGKNCVVCYQH